MSGTTPFLELPVWQERIKIAAAIKSAQATIFQSTTSSGKSLLIGPILLELGYRTLIAVPRIDLAERLCELVSKFYGMPIGTKAGYHTGDNDCWNKEETEILFCTDGSLQFIVQLLEERRFDVLALDEFHLRNTNQDLLAGITAKHWKEKTLDYKLVPLSATMQPKPIKSHFQNILGKQHPIAELNLKRRRFAVENRLPSLDTEQEEAAFLAINEGRNVLLFVAGEKDVFESVAAIKTLVGNLAVVLPIFRRLSPERKALIYEEYDRPLIIVATDIASAGFNPGPRPFSVVDSGLHKTTHLTQSGLKELRLQAISAAEEQQRCGRAGRFCEGDVYVSFRSKNIELLRLSDTRTIEPQILRDWLHNQYLDLLAIGIKMEELPLINPVPSNRITDTKNYLLSLGCIQQQDNGNDIEITTLGTLVAELPIDLRGAIAIVQAIKEHVLYDMIRIIAVHESGGVCHHDGPWNLKESYSTLVDQYDAYQWGISNPSTRSHYEFQEISLETVERLVKRIEHVLEFRGIEVNPNHQHERDSQNWEQSVRRCLCRAFIDTCFVVPKKHAKQGNEHQTPQSIPLAWGDITTTLRNRRLIGSLQPSAMVVGQMGQCRGVSVLNSATIVEPEWVLEFAAELYGGIDESTPYLSSAGQPVQDKKGTVNGRSFKVNKIPCSYKGLPLPAKAEWFALQHQQHSETGEVGTDKAGQLVEQNSNTFMKGEALQASLDENVLDLPTSWAKWYLEHFERGIELPVLSLDQEWVEFLS